jgi:mRNA-degrading endonuclease HigB of HigAB toxin-antitoxin module
MILFEENSLCCHDGSLAVNKKNHAYLILWHYMKKYVIIHMVHYPPHIKVSTASVRNNIYPKARWGYSLEFEFEVLEDTKACIPRFEFEVLDQTTACIPRFEFEVPDEIKACIPRFEFEVPEEIKACIPRFEFEVLDQTTARIPRFEFEVVVETKACIPRTLWM